MRFRQLRIAFFATCLIACVLLIVFWVRSRTTFEFAEGTILPRMMSSGKLSATHLSIHSYDNVLSVIWATDGKASKFPPWRYASRPSQMQRESWKPTYFPDEGNLGGIRFQSPYWLLMATTGVFAALPWFPISKRFSLRTLLIAMTLI